MATFADLFSSYGLGGFEPATGQQLGFFDTLGANRNALVGLGMGMMQANPFQPWGTALQGYQAGAQTDLRARQLAQQRQQHLDDLALRRETFRREPETIRQLRIMGIDPTSEQARELLYPKTEDWVTGTYTDPESERQYPYRVHRRTGQTEWLPLPGLTPPGTTRPAATPSPNTFTTGTPGVYGLGPQGFTTAPETTGQTTTPAVQPGINSAFPAPSGDVPQRPSWMTPELQGLRPSARKAAEQEYAKERVKETVKRQAGQEQAAKSAPIITEDIDRAIGAIENPRGMLPTTGLVGGTIKNFYQPGADLDRLLRGIRANVSIDKLQAMRAASPTGGALGNVSDKDMDKLEATMGSLDQSQSKEALLYNLDRLKRQIHETVHGPGTAPTARYAAPESQRAPTTTGTRRGGAAVPGAPVRVRTPEEALRYPRGTQIILPDGTPGRVP